MTGFGEAHAALSLPRLVPQVFTPIASVCALLVGAAALGATTPTGLIAAGLRWLGAPVPGPLQAVPGQLGARADVVTAATVVAMVLALWWSGLFLGKNPRKFDRARGPVTAWIGLAVIAETHEPLTALLAAGVAVAALLVVWATSAVRAQRAAPYGPTVGPVGAAAAALAGGLMLVPLYPLFVVLHGLGGVSRATRRAA